MSTETQHFPVTGDGQPPIDGGVFKPEDEQKPNRRFGKKSIAAMSVVAVGAASAAAIALWPKGGEGERTTATPIAASSSPNTLPNNGPLPTQTAETPNNSSQTPEATNPTNIPTVTETGTPSPTTTEKTTSSVVESLTPSSELYDAKTMDQLVMDGPELNAFITKFGEKYPDITVQFKDDVFKMRAALETLKPEKLAQAQSKFNDVLELETYTDESIKAGEPKLVSVGSYLTSGKYDNGATFPQGVMTPKDIEEYSKAVPNDPPVQGVSSTLVRRMDEASRLSAQLTWLSTNEKAANTYIRTMSPEQKATVDLPSSDVRQVYESLFLEQPDSTQTIATLKALADPNTIWLGCTEGVVASSVSTAVAYGPDKAPVNGLVVACEQPDAKQLVVASYAFLSVDKYEHGKKTGKTLQPFVVSAKSYSAIS